LRKINILRDNNSSSSSQHSFIFILFCNYYAEIRHSLGGGKRSINKPEERVIALDIGSVRHTGPTLL
jgi:hypothetical protein